MADRSGAMDFKLMLPTGLLVDDRIVKLIAEARDGYFCLLPRHRDFVAALNPGVLSYHDTAGKECFVATDEGVLVKFGSQVMVSAYNGVLGANLEGLQQIVEDTYLQLNESERKARTALSRLEAGTLRKFREFQDSIHG